MYFIKTFQSKNKNALQKAIYEAFKDFEHKLVADPEKFLAQIRGIVSELNAQNPRCTAARIDHYLEDYTGDDRYKSIYVLSEDWGYTITLYKVRGKIETDNKL